MGFALAMVIGGNDVANSMATAVGAKAITVKQAVIIAAILEFTGAFFFGSHVTSTITKGILNTSFLPGDVMVYGAISALIGAFVWLGVATIFGLPVSTTHSVIGGMVGFGILAGGFEAVDWIKMVLIVSSWFLSPFLGGLLAYIVFKLIAALILKKDAPINAAKRYAPLFISFTFFIIIFLFALKTLNIDFFLSLITGVVVFLLTLAGSKFIINRYIKKKDNEDRYDVVERIFRRMQVITSCYVSLSHGANDVANAVGPLAVVYIALTAGTVGTTVEIPAWILAIGGFGIALGVGLWGKRVMHTVGTRITTLNNTRGFSIDFSAATSVLLASVFGMPVSTTHTVVGAVTGVGMARGFEGVNAGVLKHIMWAWLVTVPVAGVISMLIYMVIT
ncbi:MAG: inorganic phosphate transporter [Kosmotoga sp.]|nr:MAG: inorganic phosphate transporter [Kosmotoga sp.]